MTNNSSPRVVWHRGLTLVELSIVITLILSFIFILIVGSQAWMRGSDRSSCIMTLRNAQVAMRSYQNIYGYNCGDRPRSQNGTQDIAEHLLSKGYIKATLYRQTRGLDPCPAGGGYMRPAPDMFPEPGQLYMECSFSGPQGHVPTSQVDW